MNHRCQGRWRKKKGPLLLAPNYLQQPPIGTSPRGGKKVSNNEQRSPQKVCRRVRRSNFLPLFNAYFFGRSERLHPPPCGFLRLKRTHEIVTDGPAGVCPQSCGPPPLPLRRRRSSWSPHASSGRPCPYPRAGQCLLTRHTPQGGTLFWGVA